MGEAVRAFRDAMRWGLHGNLKVTGIEPLTSRVRPEAEPMQM